jgi:RNA chaperone Hfq
MGNILRRPLHENAREFDCSARFLNRIRKEGHEVDLYLLSGIHLIGYILEFDKRSIIFDGGPQESDPKEQLVMRSAVASIIPK